MKQRVVVALATVWLASIVGASVLSGETAFSTPNPPGPTPDQYTPLLRSSRHNPQDDYSQDWMEDELSRIKVEDRREKLDQRRTGLTDLDKTASSLELKSHESVPRRSGIDVDPGIPYHFESSDMTKQSKVDWKAMRMPSMKVAFDSELYDRSSEEYWINLSVENENAMQQDENVEDEGPGSVEVYKLDLHEDGSIPSAMPSQKDYSRNKSKVSKKVLTVDDQLAWKAKDHPAWKRVSKIPSKSNYHPDRFPVSSRSLKERIFGVGGVPELQVGCEGVEGFRRQKRSDTEKPKENISGTQPNLSARDTKVDIEPDYDSEEELEEVVGEDELKRILEQAVSTTDASHKNRGDMDPSMEPNRPRKKDKLPTRGDLGPSGDPDSSYNDQVPQKIPIENQSQLTPRRKLLSIDGDLVDNDLGKRSTDQGYGKNDSMMNERKRSGYDGAQGHRRKNRRWHRGENREIDRRGNTVGGKKKAVDKTGWDYQKEQENDIRHNPLTSVTRNQPSNLLLQLSARQSGKNEHYGRQHRRREGGKKARVTDVNDKKLRASSSKRGLTPRQKSKNNHDRRQDENEVRESSFKVDAPQNLQDPHNSRTGGNERPQNVRYGEGGYRQESQQEIDRLNALPVSARIIIRQERPGMDIPRIGGRLGGTDDITFPGLSPGNDGRQVPNFSSSTSKPHEKTSSPCTWAVINCCSNRSRLATCFEANGCHGGHWDDPCSKNKMTAALQMVRQQYRG